MKDEDFALLEWVLCRTNPQVISLEYNENKNEDESVVASHIQQFFDFMK